MFNDLSSRIAAAGVAISVVVCLVVFAFQSWFQILVALMVALLTAVAAWEYAKLALEKGANIPLTLFLVFTALEVFSFYLGNRVAALRIAPALILLIAFLVFFILHFKQNEGAIVDVATALFGQLYIAVPMGMILGILYSKTGQDGRWWVAYLLVVTKITDMGAYFAGNLWGQRKLAPQISPGKTVEGGIFGLACAVAASFGFQLLSESIGARHFALGIAEWLFLGLLLGAGAQFGDLSESLLKRDANKKDSNTFPGLGGVLDSIDSLLFNAPIVYLYLNFMKS